MSFCLKLDNTHCECLTLQATPLHRTQITPPHWTPPSRQPCGPPSTTLRTEPAPDGGPPTDPGECPPTWAPDRVLPDHSISSSITNSICMFSNNLVTLIVNSHMIAWRSKSIYLQKIQCPIEMQNTWERERERIYMLVLLLHNMLEDSWSERIWLMDMIVLWCYMLCETFVNLCVCSNNVIVLCILDLSLVL